VALPLISVGMLATLSKEYGKDIGWVSMSLLIGAIGEVLSITGSQYWRYQSPLVWRGAYL